MNQPWYCKQCGKENHPNSTSCYECRAPRQDHAYPDGSGVPGFAFAPQAGYYTAPPKKKHAWVPVLITCSTLVLVAVFVGTCLAVSLPGYVKVKETAKEAEAKQNLHEIQLAVERFAVDHKGTYPLYLIGGAAKCAATVNITEENFTSNPRSAFQSIVDSAPLETVSDPLLRKGYLAEYAINPFTRNGAAIHQIQCDLNSTPGGKDILRNDSDTGLKLGTRFGPYCTQMGAVRGDVRYPRTTIIVPGTEPLEILTGVDTEYDYWDQWQGDRPLPYIPGMFFYKSMGALSTGPADTAAERTNVPSAAPDMYILAVYGGTRSKGRDILGEEEPLTGPHGEMTWTFLRSQVSTDPAHVQGCPFSFDNTGKTTQIIYGNPNGIRDAIALVLTAGEDYNGDSSKP